MKYYSLFLPIFKQGDDFAGCCESNNGHPVKSFLELSEQYKSAAEICERIAKTFSISSNLDEVEVGGCTHHIYVNAPEEIVSSLVRDAILIEEDISEDEE